uniref:Uncharacterized protein n=1 Tax=viral metagenome TaxID=1070528 RepID=A0A6C0J501_9ZZZZ
MKLLLIIIMFAGILSVTVGYVNQLKKCPPPKIEYRYIPRTFEQEQDNPVKVSELYNTMFTQPTPWIKGITESKSKNTDPNRYYITQ